MNDSVSTPHTEKESERTTSSNSSTQVKKILVAGSGAVGKTTLLQVLKADKPLEGMNASQEYHRTPFLNIETISIERIGGTGSRGIFLMVDVAGQLDLPIHALRDLSALTLGNLDLVMLMFSADSVQSLLDLQDWVAIIKTQQRGEHQLQFVLIMNKCDKERNIDSSLVEQFRQSEPCIVSYFEISCRTGEGLNAIQNWLIERASHK